MTHDIKILHCGIPSERVCVCMCMHMCMCVTMCVCLCMYVCVCVFAHVSIAIHMTMYNKLCISYYNYLPT